MLTRRYAAKERNELQSLAPWYLLSLVSYTSDDYRSYSGWGGDSIAAKERCVNRLAGLSVFVSEALRQRAVREYGLDLERTFVSPNATERRFTDRALNIVLPELKGRPGPIVGVLGALTERLNVDVLAKVVASPLVGTFLSVLKRS